MKLKFTKMHGLGNDFMVLEGLSQSIHLPKETIQRLSHRQTGIGFDQCLVLQASKDPNIDFIYEIYNANGQSVGQCGNGARCIARFIEHYQLSPKKRLRVATSSTFLELTLNPDHSVTVQFESPTEDPKNIPLNQIKADRYTLTIKKAPVYFHAIQVGNPHAILPVDSLQNVPIHTIGQTLSTHPVFPEQTNVSFMKIKNAHHLALRVYERGVGETQACGSAAVAAAAIAHLYYDCDSNIKVSLPGGDLWVNWPQKKGPIFLTGPAEFIYEGVLLDDF